MAKQFTDVSCARGAPMGRAPYGIPSDCPARSIRLFRVRLNGDYDDGGAYWGGGLGSKYLYCARYGDTYRDFERAWTRAEAARSLRLPGRLLHTGRKDGL